MEIFAFFSGQGSKSRTFFMLNPHFSPFSMENLAFFACRSSDSMPFSMLNPCFSPFGMENLAIPSDEMNRRIDESLKSLGIQELREAMTSKLSGGQKQKVSIALLIKIQHSTCHNQSLTRACSHMEK